MKVKELKKLLADIPDNYEIKSRPRNAHLDNDEMLWQLNFAGDITKVKVIDIHNIVMLIRGYE